MPIQQDGAMLETICLPRDECYRFIIVDEPYKNGMCCARWIDGQWTNGSLTLFLDGHEFYHNNGEFGTGDTVVFSADDSDGDPCNQTCNAGDGRVTIVTHFDEGPSEWSYDLLNGSQYYYTIYSGIQPFYAKDYHHTPVSPNSTMVESFCLRRRMCYEGEWFQRSDSTCEVFWNGERVFVSNGTGHEQHWFGNCFG
mmetsp:Transcript_32866/g.75673  ORF Transcript_32866/g.75673 Transcript_32866/m.75673 type:complete len:196 (+) Transcript_32866:3-590(+)